MARKSADNYEVGFCKPPVHSRFQPGTSGNPGGKRKRPETYQELLVKHARSSIAVTENGVAKTMSKQEALALRTMTQALKGDHRAHDIVVGALQGMEAKEAAAQVVVTRIDGPAFLKKLSTGSIQKLREVAIELKAVQNGERKNDEYALPDSGNASGKIAR
jgi:hypothetical protein